MSDETEKETCRCWVYKGAPRGETYLCLAEENGFDAAPGALIEQMGTLERVMEPARANAAEVMRSLESRGYYLQLPPADMPGRHRLQ